MGLYDTFYFKCIFCGEEVMEQTKAGPCMLENYRFDDEFLPTWVMNIFNEAEIECYNCHRTNRIVFDYELIVKRKAIEPVDNLDYLELESKKVEEQENG